MKKMTKINGLSIVDMSAGQVNGIASLDEQSKIPASQLPTPYGEQLYVSREKPTSLGVWLDALKTQQFLPTTWYDYKPSVSFSLLAQCGMAYVGNNTYLLPNLKLYNSVAQTYTDVFSWEGHTLRDVLFIEQVQDLIYLACRVDLEYKLLVGETGASWTVLCDLGDASDWAPISMAGTYLLAYSEAQHMLLIGTSSKIYSQLSVPADTQLEFMFDNSKDLYMTTSQNLVYKVTDFLTQNAVISLFADMSQIRPNARIYGLSVWPKFVILRLYTNGVYSNIISRDDGVSWQNIQLDSRLFLYSQVLRHNCMLVLRTDTGGGRHSNYVHFFPEQTPSVSYMISTPEAYDSYNVNLFNVVNDLVFFTSTQHELCLVMDNAEIRTGIASDMLPPASRPSVGYVRRQQKMHYAHGRYYYVVQQGFRLSAPSTPLYVNN